MFSVRDLEGMAEILHPDVVATIRSRGVFRGKDNYLAMMSSYPQGLPEAEVLEKHGGQQKGTVRLGCHDLYCVRPVVGFGWKG